MISSTRTRIAAGGLAAAAGAVLLLSGCAGTDRPATPVDSVAVPGVAPAADAQHLATDGHLDDGHWDDGHRGDGHRGDGHLGDGPLGDDRLRQFPLGDDADDRFGDHADDRFDDDADDGFDDDDDGHDD